MSKASASKSVWVTIFHCVTRDLPFKGETNLDVVRDQVRALRGNLEIDSRPGHGTRMILTLPLEIGALPLMLVKAGYRTFGLPTAAVETVVRAEAGRLDTGGALPRLSHRDQWIDCVDLAGLMGLRGGRVPEAGSPLLVVQHGGQRLALSVDGLVGDAERVVMPLPAETGKGLPYQGASVSTGRELLLVLKPSWVVRNGARDAGARVANRVLVVDDSLTARAMHRAVLESGGFTVHAVSSGEQGLEMLGQGSFSAVVCDIQMDGLDGLEFTRRARARREGRGIPILLVSQSEDPGIRQAGFDAGADAFLSKRDCAAGRLLEEVQRVLKEGA